jgi:uncharacterized protein YciI
MAVFLVPVQNGPAWEPGRSRREQAGWDEHGAFMDRLLDDGFVILGGPVGDGERALLAVEAADEAEVAARLAPDPWVAAGVLVYARAEPWTVWLDGRR